MLNEKLSNSNDKVFVPRLWSLPMSRQWNSSKWIIFKQDEKKNNQNKTVMTISVYSWFLPPTSVTVSVTQRESEGERETQPLHLTKFYLIWFHYSLNSRLLLSLTKCTHIAHIRRWNCAGSIFISMYIENEKKISRVS